MSEFEKAYRELNQEQRQAVDTLDGPVLVVAGPGSGKTQLLGVRVANIRQKTDTAPGSILCLTYTDNAAANMRRRLVTLMGPEGYKVAVHTFHSFCREIMNCYPEYFYQGAHFQPADTIIQREIIQARIEALPGTDQLRAYHPEQGFTYVRHVGDAIAYLKRAGISPDEHSEIIAQNHAVATRWEAEVTAAAGQRISKSMYPQLRELLIKLGTDSLEAADSTLAPHLTTVLHTSLQRAVTAAEQGDTSLLKEWKNTWLRRSASGGFIFTSHHYQAQQETLNQLYRQYQADLYQRGYFDFDDMILNVLQVTAEHPELALELQEHYLYLLVDEFQDTNGSQMRLLRMLTSAEAHEGRPNILVVGDDDQGIYKFQGAELSNILQFQQMYPATTLITLIQNYRSTQDILDLARHIIVRGNDRLENVIPEVKKDLRAASNLDGGHIRYHDLPTQAHQYAWVAHEIACLHREKQIPYKRMAVIARKHQELQDALPFLTHASIPVFYERQQDIFKLPTIKQVIAMARYLISLGQPHTEPADHLLAEILSYPFWKVPREALFHLALQANQSRQPWIQVMRENPQLGLGEIAAFFLELSNRAKHEPAEYILNDLIGNQLYQNGAEDSQDDSDTIPTEPSAGLRSPLKEYYFSERTQSADPARYLENLSALQTLVQAVREYRSRESVTMEEVMTVIDLYQQNNLSLNDNSPFITAESAVSLVTAHAAKGLEYDVVFVLSCQESVWAKNGNSAKIIFPPNLPVRPAGETTDDHLRLFYVSLTRAERYLYLTSYQQDAKGSATPPVQFISHLDASPAYDENTMPNKEELLAITTWGSAAVPPVSTSEHTLLAPLLERYQLSVTHLHNFLNVHDAGPLQFLQRNLLRFPEPKLPQGAYGSAIHRAIQFMYTTLQRQGSLPSLADSTHAFANFLEQERLREVDFNAWRARGQQALERFYPERSATILADHLVERDFSKQGVSLGSALLTGKIDKLVKQNTSTITVHDFKTGKVLSNWHSADKQKAIKTWKYRQQLHFYKLLVEGSRDFSGRFTVPTGSIEFVEAQPGEEWELTLELQQEETERLSRLIQAVYKKIIALDFPDITPYQAKPGIEGIVAFEDDLIEGRI